MTEVYQARPRAISTVWGGVTRLKSGSTFWAGTFPADFEIEVDAGASVTLKAVEALLEWPGDAVQGTAVDAFIWISKGYGAVGMLNGIQIDANDGGFPITSAGSVVKAFGGAVTNGIDLSGLTISGYLIKGPGIVQGYSLQATTFVRPGQTTYAGLSTADASPAVGDRLVITDASACTVNTAVTAGGGSTHSCPVVYTGASWIAEVTH